jgi:RimJ/RimL family protein N-acetyltransferase
MTTTTTPLVRIEPWTAGDFGLLRRSNVPAMTEHLGGPETEAQLVLRHKRYLEQDGTGQMFRVVLLPTGEPAGSVGFWELDRQGETVFETGWAVLPEFQRRGVATASVHAVIAAARTAGTHRWLHAFPSVRHVASNAVCRRAGFEWVGECDFEYPAGSFMRSNDWRLDLAAPGDQPPGRTW